MAAAEAVEAAAAEEAAAEAAEAEEAAAEEAEEAEEEETVLLQRSSEALRADRSRWSDDHMVDGRLAPGRPGDGLHVGRALASELPGLA